MLVNIFSIFKILKYFLFRKLHCLIPNPNCDFFFTGYLKSCLLKLYYYICIQRYPYMLQQIFSVFRFGKNRKHSQDLKGGRDDDSAQDSDFSQTHHSTSSKDQERHVCFGFYKLNLFLFIKKKKKKFSKTIK